MTAVCCLCCVGRIEINVDHVVQSPNRNSDGFTKHFVVEHAIFGHMGVQYHGAEVTDRGLVITGVERNFRAKVRRVNHAHMVLRTPHIAGVLERDPWMSCLKEHLEHFFPEIDSLHFPAPDFSLCGLFLILHVTLFKGLAVEIMKIGTLVRPEKGPLLPCLQPLHEEIGNPIRSVHVMGPATLIPGVHP